MRLSPDVVYRKYGENVYIFHRRTGESYLMSDIVFDLLSALESKCDLSLDALQKTLLEQYEVDDVPGFLSDIEAFTLSLVQKTILEEAGNAGGTADDQAQERLINRVCRENHILQRVCIELSYRCNERCKHCYVGDETKDARRELTLADYEALFDQLVDLGTLHVTLTGGEVALREDFLPILHKAVERKFAVGIFTNGIGFSRDDLYEISCLHPRLVSFSLYSGDAREHDAITGVPGSFERTLSALMQLKCAGVAVSIKTTAMTRTQFGYPALVKLARQLGAELETGYFISATNRGCVSPTELRLGDVDKYKDMMRLAPVLGRSGDPVARRLDEPICGVGQSSLSINPYGDVYPCNAYFTKLGNIKETSLAHIWNGDRLREIVDNHFSQLDEKCLACSYKDDCLYCMGAVIAENGSAYRHIPEMCLIAQASFEVRNERKARYAREGVQKP